MKSLPRITRITAITPFSVTLLWHPDELRVVNFFQLFAQWEQEGNQPALLLRDWETFKQVEVSDNGTLCWPNVRVSFQYKKNRHTAPLELDAQELYRQSTPTMPEEVLIAPGVTFRSV